MFSLGHNLIGEQRSEAYLPCAQVCEPQRLFVNQITFKTTLLCLLIPFRESEGIPRACTHIPARPDEKNVTR